MAGKAAGPCVFVLFGAAGDLTKRKLVPALFNLVRAKLLPNDFALMGVSVDDLECGSLPRPSEPVPARPMIRNRGIGCAPGCFMSGATLPMQACSRDLANDLLKSISSFRRRATICSISPLHPSSSGLLFSNWEPPDCRSNETGTGDAS